MPSTLGFYSQVVLAALTSFFPHRPFPEFENFCNSVVWCSGTKLVDIHVVLAGWSLLQSILCGLVRQDVFNIDEEEDVDDIFLVIQVSSFVPRTILDAF